MSAADDRQSRLAMALRANLRRRKAAAAAADPERPAPGEREADPKAAADPPGPDGGRRGP